MKGSMERQQRGRVRIFTFDGKIALWEAIAVVKAALDDEGLALSDANTTGDRPYAVWFPQDRQTRVMVPPTRIVERVMMDDIVWESVTLDLEVWHEGERVERTVRIQVGMRGDTLVFLKAKGLEQRHRDRGHGGHPALSRGDCQGGRSCSRVDAPVARLAARKESTARVVTPGSSVSGPGVLHSADGAARPGSPPCSPVHRAEAYRVPAGD